MRHKLDERKILRTNPFKETRIPLITVNGRKFYSNEEYDAWMVGGAE